MWDETNFYNVNTMILVKSPFRTQARSSRATKSYPCSEVHAAWVTGVLSITIFRCLVAVPHQTFFLGPPQTRRGIDDSSAKP